MISFSNINHIIHEYIVYISLMIMFYFLLSILHILSILINTLITTSHINSVSSHLILIITAYNLWFWYWLLIHWRTNNDRYWYFLITLCFILFSFFKGVIVKMYIIRIHFIVVFIVSIIIWTIIWVIIWESAIWVIIWQLIRHHWFSVVNINNIIICSYIYSVMVCIRRHFLCWYIFCGILSINIR